MACYRRPGDVSRAIEAGSVGDCPFELDRKLNRKHWREAERAEIEANGCFAEPEWREVISSDGVRCFVALDCDTDEVSS